MDQDLLATSAGYVRDSFVMASLDQYSEYEHLEKILMDAVSIDPIVYDETSIYNRNIDTRKQEKYSKYRYENYTPEPHYKKED
jgi:cell filamentation protein